MLFQPDADVLLAVFQRCVVPGQLFQLRPPIEKLIVLLRTFGFDELFALLLVQDRERILDLDVKLLFGHRT